MWMKWSSSHSNLKNAAQEAHPTQFLGRWVCGWTGTQRWLKLLLHIGVACLMEHVLVKELCWIFVTNQLLKSWFEMMDHGRMSDNQCLNQKTHCCDLCQQETTLGFRHHWFPIFWSQHMQTSARSNKQVQDQTENPFWKESEWLQLVLLPHVQTMQWSLTLKQSSQFLATRQQQLLNVRWEMKNLH